MGYAEDLVKAEGWEEAWCVFDRDDHPHFEESINKIAKLNEIKVKRNSRPTKFYAIPSNPCFELWFVIHFESITREEHRKTIQQLLSHCIPQYEKALAGMWIRLESKLPEAINHAKELRNRNKGNSNPSTDVDLLVNRLLDLKL